MAVSIGCSLLLSFAALSRLRRHLVRHLLLQSLFVRRALRASLLTFTHHVLEPIFCTVQVFLEVRSLGADAVALNVSFLLSVVHDLVELAQSQAELAAFAVAAIMLALIPYAC